MDGLQWKTPLKRMIWRYPYFWKHPYHWILDHIASLVKFCRSNTFENWPKGTYWKPRLWWGYVQTLRAKGKAALWVDWEDFLLFTSCWWVPFLNYNHIIYKCTYILFYDTSYLHVLRDWFKSIYEMHASGTLSTDAKMWRLFSPLRRWFLQIPQGLLAFSHLGAQGVRDFGCTNLCDFLTSSWDWVVKNEKLKA